MTEGVIGLGTLLKMGDGAQNEAFTAIAITKYVCFGIALFSQSFGIESAAVIRVLSFSRATIAEQPPRTIQLQQVQMARLPGGIRKSSPKYRHRQRRG